MTADTLRAAEEVAADYRIATPRAPKCGPPGKPAGNREYHRHLRFCRYHRIQCSYDEYLAQVNKGSKYGPPGSPHYSSDVQRHRKWCAKHGDCTWEEYVARSPYYAQQLDPDQIAARVERNRAKLAAMGLLK